jgi:hypothetical protein
MSGDEQAKTVPCPILSPFFLAKGWETSNLNSFFHEEQPDSQQQVKPAMNPLTCELAITAKRWLTCKMVNQSPCVLAKGRKTSNSPAMLIVSNVSDADLHSTAAG